MRRIFLIRDTEIYRLLYYSWFTLWNRTTDTNHQIEERDIASFYTHLLFTVITTNYCHNYSSLVITGLSSPVLQSCFCTCKYRVPEFNRLRSNLTFYIPELLAYCMTLWLGFTNRCFSTVEVLKPEISESVCCLTLYYFSCLVR